MIMEGWLKGVLGIMELSCILIMVMAIYVKIHRTI